MSGSGVAEGRDADPLQDDAARRRVAAELDTSLFVEAGAGSGKTTALVQRIVNLVADGAVGDIVELAAITFTEAAAAELRDRVRVALERRAEDADPVVRARIAEALDRIDEATISTLHGFAQRILAEFPIPAGLPPGFEVTDDIAAHVEAGSDWDRFLDELFADPDATAAIRRAFSLGMSVGRLRVVAASFDENWDRLPPGRFRSGPVADIDVAPLVAALDEVVRRADGVASPTAAKASSAAGDLAARLRAETDPDEQLLTVAAFSDTGVAIPGSNVTRDDLVALRDAVQAWRDLQSAWLGALRLDAIEPILARLADATLANAARRAAAGRLRFHDLLVHARNLLAGDASVRRALSNRFAAVLIDEFQDTDPLQIEIATLLCRVDPDAPVGPWAEAELAPGRLVMVGDPKQAIYRFRRADIALFTEAAAARDDGERVELAVNFRSVPSLLEWVDGVFGALLGDGRDGQAPYRRLWAAREELDGDLPSVVVLGEAIEARRIGTVREVETRDLAAALRELRDQGRPIHDADTGAVRPVRFGDIAVLVPTRAVLPELERALGKQDIPYRIESRSLVFGTDEVRELLAVLQAIDDPADEVAVVAALRSPAFACTDDALARYRSLGGRWNYVRRLPDDLVVALGAEDPVVEATDRLRALHDLRPRCTVSELVGEVIRRGRLIELTAGRARPRDHWRRYRLVLDEARGFVESGGESLAEFVAYLDEQSVEGATRVETIVSEADDDAVRILTIHGSKGLEFPVVAVAGLGTAYQAPADRVFWGAHGPEIALGAKDKERFETPGYASVQTQEADYDLFERHRLLYVACTRARDLLVVALHRQAGKRHNAAAWLAEVLPPSPATGEPASGVAPSVDLVAGAGLAADVPATDVPATDVPAAQDTFAAWQAERDELLARISRPRTIAPTAVAALAGPRPPETADDPGGDDPGGDDPGGDDPGGDDPGGDEHLGEDMDAMSFLRRRRGRAGTAIGRAVHATLQRIDAAGEAVAALARREAESEGLPDAADTVAALARAALASPTVAAGLAAPRHWRELEIVAPVGRAGTLVEGFVDLLFETADGELIVVDYKTDGVRTDADLDAALDRYRLQGAAYAAALEAMLDRRVARCVFVFARAGGAVEREIADLPAAVAEVCRLLDADRGG